MSEVKQRLLRMHGDRAYRLARAITGDDRSAQEAVHGALAACDESADGLDLMLATHATAREAGRGTQPGAGEARLAAEPGDVQAEELAETVVRLAPTDQSALLAALTGQADARGEGFEGALAAALMRLDEVTRSEFRLRDEDIP